MGTNFYISDPPIPAEDADDPNVHIGKRSAAGFWCWDCGVTLAVGGLAAVHTAPARRYTTCPRCGQAPRTEPLEAGAAGRELGFNRASPQRKHGVASCSSFTWAMPAGRLEGVREIRDEYGTVYTPAEFTAVLSECPIQYTDKIGRRFC